MRSEAEIRRAIKAMKVMVANARDEEDSLRMKCVVDSLEWVVSDPSMFEKLITGIQPLAERIVTIMARN